MEIHGCVGHAQGQERREEEVGHGQVEEPNGVDGLLHLEARHPDNHAIPEDSQNKSQAVDDQAHGVERLPQLRVLVPVVVLVVILVSRDIF